jgi:hypothetical protein
MEIVIKDKKAEEFTAQLWEKIKTTGFNAMSKNDFYDYVLYLFNKYNGTPFLDDASNYENAILLKATESKIKNSKLNIALKYKNEQERKNTLYIFLRKIADKKITILDKGNYFVFMLDDPSARMEFENGLKQIMGTTLEYSGNRERVQIEKYDFLNILKIYASCDETQFVETLKAELDNQELKNMIKSNAKTFFAKVGELAKEITVEIAIGLIQKTIIPAN